MVAFAEARPFGYELVSRRFARRLVHETVFFITFDGELRSASGEFFARGCETATYPKDENLFSFLIHGWPEPVQGGQVIVGPNGEHWKRIFVDDLFLCPDCGSFHLKNEDRELLNFYELERNWNSFKINIEARTNVKEFYLKHCENRVFCEMFKRKGLKKFTSWNRQRKKTEAPKPILIPEVEIKEEEPAESKVFVYLIEANSFYKIGIATDVTKRLASLQTSSPHQMKVLKSWESAFAQKAERYLHRHFKDCRQKGEWFRLSSEQVQILLNILNLDEFISRSSK
jgi:hypothetical protein